MQALGPSLKNLGFGLLSVIGHVTFVLVFKFNVFWCGKPEFVNYGNWFTRVGYYCMAMTGQRFMYYVPWFLNDAGSIACGLSYNGKDEHQHNKWDRVISIFAWELETASTPVKMMEYWNHCGH